MTTKVSSNDQLETALVTTGTSPAFEITKPGETTLKDNEYFLVNFHDNASSAVTIDVNSVGAKALEDEAGDPVATIVADQDYRIKRDVSKDAFVVVGSIGGGGGSTSTGNEYLILSDTLTGLTPVDIVDSRITSITPYIVFCASQPAGIITKTLTNGQLTLVSDDAGDTMNFQVLFWNIGPSRQYMKGTETLTGAGPWVINDIRFTATTPAMVMPRTAPVGFLTAATGTGTFTISSTGTEAGVVVDYIVTLDTVNYSDSMPYNPTVESTDMFFRKGISGDDEACTLSDLRTRTFSTTDEATSAIDCDTIDNYFLTAVANATTFTVTGIPVDGQKLMIRILDAGVTKALTFTGFREIGVTLPTTTTPTKTHYIGCVYNADDAVRDVLAVGVEL